MNEFRRLRFMKMEIKIGEREKVRRLEIDCAIMPLKFIRDDIFGLHRLVPYLVGCSFFFRLCFRLFMTLSALCGVCHPSRASHLTFTNT